VSKRGGRGEAFSLTRLRYTGAIKRVNGMLGRLRALACGKALLSSLAFSLTLPLTPEPEGLPPGAVRLNAHEVSFTVSGGQSLLSAPEGTQLTYRGGAWWIEDGPRRTRLPLEGGKSPVAGPLKLPLKPSSSAKPPLMSPKPPLTPSSAIAPAANPKPLPTSSSAGTSVAGPKSAVKPDAPNALAKSRPPLQATRPLQGINPTLNVGLLMLKEGGKSQIQLFIVAPSRAARLTSVRYAGLEKLLSAVDLKAGERTQINFEVPAHGELKLRWFEADTAFERRVQY